MPTRIRVIVGIGVYYMRIRLIRYAMQGMQANYNWRSHIPRILIGVLLTIAVMLIYHPLIQALGYEELSLVYSITDTGFMATWARGIYIALCLSALWILLYPKAYKNIMIIALTTLTLQLFSTSLGHMVSWPLMFAYYRCIARAEESIKMSHTLAIQKNYTVPPRDSFLWAIIIAIAFAWWENIVYAIREITNIYESQSLIGQIVTQRWLTTIAIHTACTSIIAYLYRKRSGDIIEKNLTHTIKKFIFYATALTIGVLVHTLYNVALQRIFFLVPFFWLASYLCISYCITQSNTMYLRPSPSKDS